MEYRKDIDGLRAFAIIPVLLFHAGFSLFGGGYIGVDIFFVISGYLITSIIISDIEQNRFSIFNFYERRIRRILPALYIVMLFTFGWAFLFWAPYDLKNVAQSITATTFFANNILLILEVSDYFGALNDIEYLNPLLHTWSLAVEEQFYLIYPIILIIIVRFRKFTILFISLAIISSFIYAELKYQFEPRQVFYASHTRAWELLTGAISAVIYRNWGEIIHSKFPTFSNTVSSFGLFLIVASVLLINEGNLKEFHYLVFPVLGTFLVILFTKNNIVYKILSNKIAVYIGLISYSLYLWHQPIFTIFAYKVVVPAGSNPNLANLEIIIALTIIFIISIISYRFIEQPFRNKNTISTKITFIVLPIATIIFATIGYYGHITHGYLSAKIDADKINKYINQNIENYRVKKTDWQKIANKGSEILIIGDSTSADLQKALLSLNIIADRYELDGGCHFKLITENYCKNHGNKLIELDKLIKGKKIIYIANDLARESIILGDLPSYKFKEGYKLLYSYLSRKADTYFFTPFEFWKPTNVSYKAVRDNVNVGNVFYNNLHFKIDEMEKFIKTFVPENKIINKKDLFCSDKDRSCSVYDQNGKPIFYDGIHHTVEGWSYFGNILSNIVRANLQKQNGN